MDTTTVDIMNVELYAPRHYNAGYVALSYFISLVGSLSTLELLQLRTSRRGLYNWYLLIGSSVTMGGIAIWSMHFVGNRATVLYEGQEQLQLAYNPTFTIVSFFVPIIFLLGAYSLADAGTDDVPKVRVGFGGLFAGSSICGMHYLGNHGIANFRPTYSVTHIVASVVIAVAATNIALTLFFLMRKNFTNSWWKRVLLAIALAGGVSGMHWTASTGTKYKFKRIKYDKQSALSRQWVVILVIVLSVFSCIVLLVFAVSAGHHRRIWQRRAQRIVLASATFEGGKLMVLPNGTLPMKTITDTFPERSFEEGFGKRHQVFQWIYRTSRNWKGVVNLLPGMQRHLRVYTTGIQRADQQSYEEYSVLFREMFCIAAKDLADATHQPLESIGALYEDILFTGLHSGGSRLTTKPHDTEAGTRRHRGQGKVLFLVKNVNKTEAARLATLGFRFTPPPNVYDILSRTMQVSKDDITKAITRMAASDPRSEALLTPGVYLGCFAVQSDEKGGYNILVRGSDTGRLPVRPLGISTLTPGHFRFLQKYNGRMVGDLATTLRSSLGEAVQTAGLPREFAEQFSNALAYLLLDVKDSFFNSAILDASPQFLPTTTLDKDPSRAGAATVAQLVVFKILVPNHITITAPSLTFTPLAFFATQQRSYLGCPDHEAHARRAHREFSGRAMPLSGRKVRSNSTNSKFWAPDASSASSLFARVGWRLKLGGKSSSRCPSMSSEKNLVIDDPFPSAGIMVSQTITVNVAEPKNATEMRDLRPRVAVTKFDDSTDNLTWCEALSKSVVSQDTK